MTRNIEQTNSLRIALKADATASAAMGLLLLVAGGWLAEPLGVGKGLLVEAGIVLVVFAAFVLWTGLRAVPSRGAVRAIVVVNGLWVVASVATAFAAWLPLTTLGTLFVLAQAAAVLVLALWQVIASGRAVLSPGT
ncbi:hypothetical protein Rhe02_01570 [Rhizocola hellebori]|uniref:DUF2568 domain-containing protein n=2 Tax=Rhizocola hellebori TaxID=1392758 RepID=A0A8J3Q2D4_9ACTN|nr:hypothetical protein Rhe02_01570 [Rhizocola hellebori]